MAQKSGRDKNVLSLADAARDLARQKRRRNDPPPQEGRGEDGAVRAGQWTPDKNGLPSEEDCPVIPLGHEPGCYHFIDSMGQFCTLTASDFSHAGITSLFAAAPHYPQWAWPRYGRGKPGEPPPIKSFDDDHARIALMRACTREGTFTPNDKLRGRGMWSERGGALLYHAGEELWTCEVRGGKPHFKAHATGLREGFLYPRLPNLPAPAAVGDDPVPSLLRTFAKWNFEGPRLGPEKIPMAAVLLLGWIANAYLGGALGWRSSVLMLGDWGTGKSTLQEGIRALFGDALFHSEDPTGASIYQRMAHDVRPIALDELEAEADDRRVQAVIRLMRIAASGGKGDRGGSGGIPIDYTLRSAFLFSMINNPVQNSQDLSRLAVIRLREFDPDQEPPPPIDQDLCGRVVLGRVMAGWPRFDELLAEYMRALKSGGHSPRGGKTYGTLLAAADLLISPEAATELGIPLVSTDQVAEWATLLAAETLSEIEDADKLWRNCLHWLLTAQVQPWRNGARQTVGQALEDLREEEAKAHDGKQALYHREAAKRDLALTGLGLFTPDEFEVRVTNAIGRTETDAQRDRLLAIHTGAKGSYVLAVPSKKRRDLASLFVGSAWQHGSWKDALRTGPPAIVVTDKAINKLRIGGVDERCTLVVLKNFQEAAER